MRKKLFSIFLATILATSLFGGCSAKEASTSSTEEQIAKKSTNSKPPEKKERLTVWAWDKAFNIYSIKEAEKIYQKEHPNFELCIVTTTWDVIEAQLETIMETKDYSMLPDILLLQDFSFQKYAVQCPDLFSDLTDTGIAFSEFSEGKMAHSTVNGRHYGIPFDNGTEVAAYRTDILAEAGYTIEDLTDIDWNRFIEIGIDVKEKTGCSLISTHASSTDLINQMLQSAGKTVWNEDGTPNFVNNNILKQAFSIYVKMVKTGVMNPAETWDDYIKSFNSGETCTAMNGCWILASVQAEPDQSGLWKITNMPSMPGVKNATNYSSQGGSTWAITSSCSDVNLAADFMGSTFGGSLELYDTILPTATAIASWLPASQSDVYHQPHEFFQGQTIYTMITDYASKTPGVTLGVYFAETNDALGVALNNVIDGADIDTELANAEKVVLAAMNQ